MRPESVQACQAKDGAIVSMECVRRRIIGEYVDVPKSRRLSCRQPLRGETWTELTARRGAPRRGVPAGPDAGTSLVSDCPRFLPFRIGKGSKTAADVRQDE